MSFHMKIEIASNDVPMDRGPRDTRKDAKRLRGDSEGDVLIFQYSRVAKDFLGTC